MIHGRWSGTQRIAVGAEINESAGHGHEKHDDGDDADHDRRGIAPRRRQLRPATLAAFVPVISTRGRIFASASTDVFDDEFDVLDDG